MPGYTISPNLESDMPSMKYSLVLFTSTGFLCTGITNKILNMPFFFRPHRHVMGIIIGFVSGYVIHNIADYARIKLLKANIWKRRELERRSVLIDEALKNYNVDNETADILKENATSSLK